MSGGASLGEGERIVEEAPRQAVWDLVTSPAHRPRWQRSDGVVENAVQGRRGVGTQNHCLHGKDAIIEDVLDWCPFDYVTKATLLPIPGAPKILMSYTFEERGDGGTHFEFRIAKPKPKDLPFYEQIRPAVQENYTIGLDVLRSMLEERGASQAVVEESSMPALRERFLTQPVHAR